MAASSGQALAIGTVLGPYTIRSVLGAGGFGITYKAVEAITERVVAVKEYLPRGAAERARDGRTVRALGTRSQSTFDWGLQRFRDEARTLIALRHPNIVQALQYFEANGTGYIAMEYESGAALGALLQSGESLHPDEVVQLVGPLLDGLEAVHAKGFLHRDVKPDNIFIRRDGTPVLIDFGAARQALGGKANLTAIVSAGYAPFEQYEDAGQQGPWSDIYGLGATLYRCVVGRKPPDAPGRMLEHTRGLTDSLAPASAAAPPGHDKGVLALIDRALAVEAEARPQSIAECRAILAAHAPPRPLAPRSRRLEQRSGAPVPLRGGALFWSGMLAVMFGYFVWLIALVLSVGGLETGDKDKKPDAAETLGFILVGIYVGGSILSGAVGAALIFLGRRGGMILLAIGLYLGLGLALLAWAAVIFVPEGNHLVLPWLFLIGATLLSVAAIIFTLHAPRHYAERKFRKMDR